MSMFLTSFVMADYRGVRDNFGRVTPSYVPAVPPVTFEGILASTDPNEQIRYSQQEHTATDSISIFGPNPGVTEGDRIFTQSGKLLYVIRIVDPGDIGFRTIIYCEYAPGEVLP